MAQKKDIVEKEIDSFVTAVKNRKTALKLLQIEESNEIKKLATVTFKKFLSCGCYKSKEASKLRSQRQSHLKKEIKK